MPGVISVLPTHYLITRNGTPAAGGLLYVYSANTTSPLPSWSDKAQMTLNTNPIILDSQGQASIWLEAGQVYDLVLKDNPLGSLTGEPGATIRTYEDVSGASSAVATTGAWIETGLTPNYVDARTFSVTGNQIDLFTVGRRVRMVSPTTTRYATVLSRAFSTVTTVIVGFYPANTVDSTLSGVSVSVEDPSSPSIMVGDGSTINMTAYAGADIKLTIGQSAVYDVTSVTAHLLRIATGDNELYDVRVLPTFVAGVASGAASTLQPNNVNTAASAVSIEAIFGQQNTPSAGIAVTDVFSLDAGFTVNKLHFECCTRTNGKTVESYFRNVSTTNHYVGLQIATWNDITTPWSSLGTINFANALTGRIMVKRLL